MHHKASRTPDDGQDRFEHAYTGRPCGTADRETLLRQKPIWPGKENEPDRKPKARPDKIETELELWATRTKPNPKKQKENRKKMLKKLKNFVLIFRFEAHKSL